MNFLGKRISNRIKRTFSVPPNKILLECSREAGFDMPEIRRALIALNRVNMNAVTEAHNRQDGSMIVSPATMSRAINGRGEPGSERIAVCCKLLAGALGLAVADLFPAENDGNGDHGGNVARNQHINQFNANRERNI